jgi:DNA-binding transcriptional ArsR family regulator
VDLASPALPDLDWITAQAQAAALLDPLRLEILALARSPASAAEIAGRLRLPRQRVNYHVRLLADRGLLRKAGRQRKGNMTEQRYIAAARGFLLAPELAGPVAPDWREISDASGAAYLLALASRLQSDVARADAAASREGRRFSTLTLKSQFRFESAAQRAEFARALRQAVVDVIARFTSPDEMPGTRPAPGGPYRLVLGCYPYAAVPEGEARGE